MKNSFEFIEAFIEWMNHKLWTILILNFNIGLYLKTLDFSSQILRYQTNACTGSYCILNQKLTKGNHVMFYINYTYQYNTCDTHFVTSIFFCVFMMKYSGKSSSVMGEILSILFKPFCSLDPLSFQSLEYKRIWRPF
jgi:hypothetical protein